MFPGLSPADLRYFDISEERRYISIYKVLKPQRGDIPARSRTEHHVDGICVLHVAGLGDSSEQSFRHQLGRVLRVLEFGRVCHRLAVVQIDQRRFVQFRLEEVYHLPEWSGEHNSGKGYGGHW